MVGFFGGVGYFGVGFFGDVVQVVGVVAVVGFDWLNGLCVCDSVDGLCLCVSGSVDGLCLCLCVCVALCVW